MAYIRLSFLFFFFLAGPFQVQGQKNPVLYAGFDYYRHTDFAEDSYANLNAGIQIYQLKFFAPEVGYDLFWGDLRERKIYRSERGPEDLPDILERNFRISLLTLAPKLKIGREDAFLTLVPKYHTGTISAKGNYYTRNEDYYRYDLEERQGIDSFVSFWSFSIGFEAYIFESDRSWFTLFLNYTNLDARAVLEKLDFSHHGENYSGKNTSTVGFGLRFYYNPFPSEND